MDFLLPVLDGRRLRNYSVQKRKKNLEVPNLTPEAGNDNKQHQVCSGVADPRARDQQHLMQFPFFSLSKKRRLEPIVYSRDDVNITVRGLPDVGIATIWDADFLIWAASQLNDARERGEVITPRLWVVPFRFMRWTKRIKKGKGGKKTYTEFSRMLVRLQGTQIMTSISAGGRQIKEVWSWIDTWKSHEQDGRINGIEVVLSDWFYRAVIIDRTVLSISPEYFLLSGGIERWLYKIARKHCGNNDCWFFTARRLFQKYPAGRPFRKFKSDLKAIVLDDPLPEYHVTWDDRAERVMFSPRDGALEQRRLPRVLRAPVGG